MMIMLLSHANAISSPSSSTDEAEALRSTGCFLHFPAWLSSPFSLWTQWQHPTPNRYSYSTHHSLSHSSLSYNGLHGSIPPEIGKLQNLNYLFLDYNNLTGVIPSSFGNLTNLIYLYLDSNQISGFIPPQIGKIKNLELLELSYNGLHGPIPLEIGKLKNLKILNLGYNNLIGVIPSSFGNRTNLTYLTLGGNQISGFIPPEIGKMKNLIFFNLGYNSLTVGKFERSNILQSLRNNLSGTIPLSISNNMWTLFDLSHNQLEGQSTAPLEASDHNKGLCDGIKGLSHCKKIHQIILIIVISLSATLLLLVADFDIKYCIGTGGYGSVYRAQLPSGKRVNVVKGIANALSYMHHDSTLPIIHRDISSTYGYIAPASGDLVTSLSSSSTQNITLKDVLDSRLSSPKGPQVANDIALVVSLALKCLHCNPRFRPSMQQVSWRLSASKSFPQPVGAISLLQLKNEEI
ncbi:hypothetical protein AAG906_023175 [Vitis piasezkii]